MGKKKIVLSMISVRLCPQTGDAGGSAGRPRPTPRSLVADGTVGGAGHAEAILKAGAPTGRLVGCDRDGAAV